MTEPTKPPTISQDNPAGRFCAMLPGMVEDTKTREPIDADPVDDVRLDWLRSVLDPKAETVTLSVALVRSLIARIEAAEPWVRSGT